MLVRDGEIVGGGWHRQVGGPHAEVEAFRAAGPLARGATLYVTLEPCSHYGRTPPCADAVIAAGVSRVVACHGDPDPRVAGRGFEKLRAAGIEVEVGVLAEEAVQLNLPFLVAAIEQRPQVTLKWAMSLDGRIATATRESQWISAPEGRRWALSLREEHDAILVGSGTVLADDPRLSVRDVVRRRPWYRVVFDRRLRIPLGAALLATPADGQVIMVAPADAVARRGGHVADLTARGAIVLEADSLDAACRRLVPLGIQTLLVEGGAALHRSFWEVDLVDRVHLVAAPGPLGAAGVPVFGGFAVPWARLSDVRSAPCGRDVWIEGDVHRTG